jgi:hypothetical protein
MNLDQILGGIVIALLSGIIGTVIGSKGRVRENLCDERRSSCSELIAEKIDNLAKIVEKLERSVNNKLLGL